MDGDFVGQASELYGYAFKAFDEERGVRDPRSLRTPRSLGKGVRARVDGDREGTRLGAGSVEDIAAVACAHVDEDVAERGG